MAVAPVFQTGFRGVRFSRVALMVPGIVMSVIAIGMIALVVTEFILSFLIDCGIRISAVAPASQAGFRGVRLSYAALI